MNRDRPRPLRNSSPILPMMIIIVLAVIFWAYAITTIVVSTGSSVETHEVAE